MAGEKSFSREENFRPGSLVFSQSNLTPPASGRAARNLSASVKQQASRTNFIAPFGGRSRQDREEVLESADTTLVFSPQMSLFLPNSLRDAGLEVEWEFPG